MESPFEQGRAAPPSELGLRLANAPPAYLQGALANPALATQHLLAMLRNPYLTGEFIRRISLSPVWMKTYRLRSQIAAHPKTPRVLALRLLPTLGWSDLARLIERPALPPQLRRASEGILALRLEHMSCGEKVSLARIAGRGILAALGGDSSPMVIRALLQNPRVREEDVLRIAARPLTPGAVLQALAESRRFGPRREIRKAVAGHPGTPPPVALRALRSLPPRELRELLQMPRMPRLVRVAAERLIEGTCGTADRRAADRSPHGPLRLQSKPLK